MPILALLLAFTEPADAPDSSDSPSSESPSDSPTDSPSDSPTDSPSDSSAPQALGERILVLAPKARKPEAIASTLQALIDGDGLEQGTQVVAYELPAPASTWISQMSLFTAWYQHTDREERLGAIEGPWDHVILADSRGTTAQLPEFTFEGVARFSEHFEDAQVHLLLEAPSSSYDFEEVTELSYRIAEGTGVGLVPAGLAAQELGGDWSEVAAASIYSSLSGVSASRSSAATELADPVHELVQAQLGVEHFSGPYRGAVVVQERELPDSYGILIAGTSSENGYRSALREFLNEREIPHHDASLGKCNDYRAVTEDCLETASGMFESADYVSLYARMYEVTHADVVAAGGGDIQSQVYDRHWDATDNDGHNALDDIETRMGWVLLEARERGLTAIPYHAFWGRLHDAEPDTDLLKDGVHATNDMSYAMAAMSFVAATGSDHPAEGVSERHAELSALAKDLVLEWATLELRD